MPKNLKKTLTEKLLANTISPEELKQLMDPNIMSIEDLQPIILRIFNLNQGAIINKSSAHLGAIGKLNRISQKRRDRRYRKKIKNGFRAKSEQNIVILAEGDSWFEFPIFLNEVIDHLSKRKNYAVKSLAYGADWLSNILYEGKYVTELDIHKPEVFLISGGGNDLVGGYRLSKLVHKNTKQSLLSTQTNLPSKYPNHPKRDAKRYNMGKRFLNKDYEALMNVFRIQYTLLFKSIYHVKSPHKDLITLTHGYDYGIPSKKINFSIDIRNLHQPFLNLFLRSGKWLYEPLMINGIIDPTQQKAIIYAMIEDFNEMLIDIGDSFPNVIHIDTRGMVKEKDWFDELHPKGKVFKKIAEKFSAVIDNRFD